MKVKISTVQAVLNDLRGKRNEITQTIKQLEKFYSVEDTSEVEDGLEVVKQQVFETAAALNHEKAETTKPKRLSSVIMELAPRRPFSAAMIHDMAKRTGKDIKKQSVLAELSKMFLAGQIRRISKGVYQRKGVR
jgi:hypothetical protein